jgi:hypothetical protein
MPRATARLRSASKQFELTVRSFSAIDLDGPRDGQKQNQIGCQKDESVNVGDECEGEITGGLHTIRCITSKLENGK